MTFERCGTAAAVFDDGKVMTVQMDYKLFVQEEQSRNEIVVFNLFLNLFKNLFTMYTYICNT